MPLTINGQQVEIEANDTILMAARKAGIDIPTLCFDPDLPPQGNCRLCLVEADGRLVSSCDTLARDGMVVITESEKILHYRKLNLEILLSRHDFTHDTLNYPLKQMMAKLGIDKSRFPKIARKEAEDKTNLAMHKDDAKCILCGNCIQKCSLTQEIDAVCFKGRAQEMTVDTGFHVSMKDSPCISCGLCALVCPTGALREVDETDRVREMLKKKDKHLIVQIAPSVRVTIGEEFGYPPGTMVKGKLVAALRKMGFHKVFDTNVGADLTTMEEASELVDRIKTGKPLPLITSCCPGWVNYAEAFYPDLLPHLSSCKSPQLMLGAMVKTYYAKQQNLDPADILVISIMPCIAKKQECLRKDMNAAGYHDVDLALTTRETARLIKSFGIDLKTLPEEDFDHPLGLATGGGVVFGSTGGVMESALRTGYYLLMGEKLHNVDIKAARGLQGVRRSEIDAGNIKLHFAIAHGIGNTKPLLEEIRRGESPYQFIEVMACLGGCLGGGGQPIPTNDEIRKARMKTIYAVDKNTPLRCSYENPLIQQFYREFLGQPLSERSHKILHCHYNKRSIYHETMAL